ncbi:GNAT family N-acetyltransferase [Aquabacterium sp.]|uniref:GNAT family N-acetyltransferase n=1 Tax=Aquabacterium sp. TaxID=1872578 RepID=UPI002CDA67AF|nr:GNAT family N-acetyltransferase [Aquabacterium sp.]HSW04968.1 GNAT family N-acetyltransferase [Aquabacterium sp.]
MPESAAPPTLPRHHQLQLRPAATGDVPALVALAKDTFRDTYRHLDTAEDIEDHVTRNFTPAAFLALLEDSRTSLLLAALDVRLVGYAQVAQSPAPPCVSGPAPIELCRLYLRQDVIGQGLGAALMEAVHAEARRREGQTLWLGVYDRNERARDFYRRWGFVDVGTKDFYFGGRTYADPVMSAPVRPCGKMPALPPSFPQGTP